MANIIYSSWIFIFDMRIPVYSIGTDTPQCFAFKKTKPDGDTAVDHYKNKSLSYPAFLLS